MKPTPEDASKIARSEEYQQGQCAMDSKDYRTASQLLAKLAKSSISEKNIKLIQNALVAEFYCSWDPKTMLSRFCELLVQLGKKPRRTNNEEEELLDERREGAVLKYNISCLLLYLGKEANVTLLLKDHLLRRGDTFYVKNLRLNLQLADCLLNSGRTLELEKVLLKLLLFSFFQNQQDTSFVLHPTGSTAKPSPTVPDYIEARFLFHYYLALYALEVDSPGLAEYSIDSISTNLLADHRTPKAVVEQMLSYFVLLKAQYHYTLCNYGRSLRLLTSEYKSNSHYEMLLLKNNIGVVHFAQGKPSLAAKYFWQATAVSSKAARAGSLAQSNCNGALVHVLANSALAYLQMGQHRQSYRIFKELAEKLNLDFKFWYRFGQACLGCYSDIVRRRMQSHSDFLIRKVCESRDGEDDARREAIHRKYSLFPKQKLQSGTPADLSPADLALIRTLLEEALKCFRTVLLLIRSQLLKEHRNDDFIRRVRKMVSKEELTALQEARQRRASQLQIWKQNTQLLLTYVLLCKGQWGLALLQCREQLSSSSQRDLLADLYYGEALIEERRYKEAKKFKAQVLEPLLRQEGPVLTFRNTLSPYQCQFLTLAADLAALAQVTVIELLVNRDASESASLARLLDQPRVQGVTPLLHILVVSLLRAKRREQAIQLLRDRGDRFSAQKN